MTVIPKVFFNLSGFRLLNRLSKRRKKRRKTDSIQFSEKWIPRRDGSKIRVCLFSPIETKGSTPGLLWFHGGGYAIGAPEQTETIAKRFIEASDCIIVAPDYRLSMEAPYPAALEDCYETLLWMKTNADELGIRDDQLMIGGDSAGGGLTAALSLYARDTGEVAIAFQMPLYPMLDDRMTSVSATDNNAPVWNSKSNSLCWNQYLGELFGGRDIPCYAAPARAINYCNLPPTATFVGELEPFRDEVIQYVENLRSAGVLVDFEVFKGCYHAFEQMCPKAEISKKAVSFLMNSFIHAIDTHFAKQNIPCQEIMRGIGPEDPC